MHIHFLVAAHQHAHIFGALLRAIDANESTIYVHVDAKVDQTPFEAAAPSGAVFVENVNRVSVQWGSWSQVESTLALMKLAAPMLSESDYVVLLSGDSYPLQGFGGLVEFFERKQGTQFLNSVQMPSEEMQKPLRRVSRFYFPYDPRSKGRHLVRRVVNRIGFPRNYKRHFAGRRPFAGSNWWALTGSAVRWILAETQSDQAFVRYCRFAQMPDEFFFQTLLGASPFAQNTEPGIMFADFSRPSGPKPAPIEKFHLAELRNSGLRMPRSGYGQGIALFARKFDSLETLKDAQGLWLVKPNLEGASDRS